jgi:hypothetical protein
VTGEKAPQPPTLEYDHNLSARLLIYAMSAVKRVNNPDTTVFYPCAPAGFADKSQCFSTCVFPLSLHPPQVLATALGNLQQQQASLQAQITSLHKSIQQGPQQGLQPQGPAAPSASPAAQSPSQNGLRPTAQLPPDPWAVNGSSTATVTHHSHTSKAPG